MSQVDKADEQIRVDEPNISKSLDPTNWGNFSQQAHRMLDDMLGYTENIRARPVWQVIPDDVRGRFRQSIPKTPTGLAEVHEEFMTSILSYTSVNAHPGRLGWVPGGGPPVGKLAEILAAGLYANVGGRDQIPLEVERQVTEWMRELFTFPLGATGLFVTGTSMASFIATVVARDAKLGFDVRNNGMNQERQKLTAYASSAVHGSIGRALVFAGLGSDSLRLIPIDSGQRIDLEALANRIIADRAAGSTPFLVIGTAGTVDTGAIDDLAGIAELCAQEHLWFHVDGAYGALAMLAPELAPRLSGIERADSLAFDFHKWTQVPYDAGFILVRNGSLHHQAFASSCANLNREERGKSAGSPWPCDFGPDLSRGFRALKTWMTLKLYGTEAIGKVITHSCELAHYLETCIAANPELELMAAVELNIVCFRYCFGASTDAAPDQLSDQLFNQLNSQIVITLQESGAVAPSTTLIGGRLAIRAAIANHRTSHAEINALVDAVLVAGRALAADAAQTLSPTEDKAYDGQMWHEWDARVLQLDQQLQSQVDRVEGLPPNVEVALRFERATLLTRMGRDLEARSDHLKVLVLDPSHLPNLIDLGRLLVVLRRPKAAQMVYSEAVRLYPHNIVCRVNLGGALLELGEDAAARQQYEAALRIGPEFPQAHGGMYYALSRLGDLKTAAIHQRIAFGRQSVMAKQYRGSSPPIPVLLLVSSTGGNTPIESLLDDRVFQTYIIVADFYDHNVPLPAHQLVVNGIGDVDVAEDALIAAERLLALTVAPTINTSQAVLATGRCENAQRLGRLPGVIAPATALLSRALLAGPDGPAAIHQHGLTFPLLLRTPGFHMGKHFVHVESPAALADAVAEMPGTELLAIEYLDARGADGCARKYRVMMIDGCLYPLHLAISSHWKIHYFSADMADRPENRAEEAHFLADVPRVLGSKAMAALERVQTALCLDYAGIDFGLNPQGEILLFEANATMVVQQPDEGEHWDYRRTAVERIHAAVRQMLTNRIRGISANVSPTSMIAAESHFARS